MDNVVTSTIAFEGNGHVAEYVGGYGDWLRQGGRWPSQDGTSNKTEALDPASDSAAKLASEKTSATSAVKKKKLSYKFQRELDALPAQIEAAETLVETLEAECGAADFYQKDHETVSGKLAELGDAQAQLEALYDRWSELEEMQDSD